MQTIDQQNIASIAREDYARVKSYLEKSGAPFYDSEQKRRINNTSIVEITDKLAQYLGGSSKLNGNRFYLKLEYKNPLTESVKGRAVASMVLKSIKTHAIYNKSGTKKNWVEPTSGNTGKGLAEIASLLGVEFTAVFSRLDVSDEIKAYLGRFGPNTVTIGSEYSLGDLEAFAQKRGKKVSYYWSNFGGPNEDTQSRVSDKVIEERAKYSEKSTGTILKEIDGSLLLDKLLPLGLEASNSPIVSRAQNGEFEKIKMDLLAAIPELSDQNQIVAFVCPIGNTSLVISTLLNQLGFANVCSIQGGLKSLRTEASINSASSEFCPVPGAPITKSSIEFVRKLVADNPEECFTFMQYDNIENIYAHVMMTGPELQEQIKDLDYVVCTFGTGGTATGLAKYFADKRTKVIVSFPDRPVEGIRTLSGADGLAFYKPELYAQVIKIGTSAMEGVLGHFVKSGFGFGPSTAVALLAAIDVSENQKGKSFAIIAADSIENYKSEYKNIL
ncbi:MAG: pyridoxal-phosphate dependent enzyme [Nitrososphaerales archaeon]